MPLVGIVAGRCFAGNAALLGCCDVVIATAAARSAWAARRWSRAAASARSAPEEIGPSDVQSRSGVIDVLVADEAEAVAARQALPRRSSRAHAAAGTAATRPRCATSLPANRLRAYDIRAADRALVATPARSLELRAGFGAGVVTALARIEGRPIGMLANNPRASRRRDRRRRAPTRRPASCSSATRTACRSSRLIDTPGLHGRARRSRRARRFATSAGMFVVGAHLRVPVVALVAAQGATASARWRWPAGGLHAPLATVGLAERRVRRDGARGRGRARLPQGARAPRPRRERDALRERAGRRAVRGGKAINMAATLEIDAVIDPADTPSLDRHDARDVAGPTQAAAASSIPGSRRPGARLSRLSVRSGRLEEVAHRCVGPVMASRAGWAAS